jgi:hypothetical protein
MASVMKSEPASPEVLTGLVERVTYRTMAITFGLPSVNVPVLCTTRVTDAPLKGIALSSQAIDD